MASNNIKISEDARSSVISSIDGLQDVLKKLYSLRSRAIAADTKEDMRGLMSAYQSLQTAMNVSTDKVTIACAYALEGSNKKKVPDGQNDLNSSQDSVEILDEDGNESSMECQEARDYLEREKTTVVWNRGAYLVYEQWLAEQNMAGETKEGWLSRLQLDDAYSRSMKLPGMDNDTALKIAYMKISLQSMLPYVPAETRGAIVDYTPFFGHIIERAIASRQAPRGLFVKVLRVFRQVVDITSHVPACLPILRHLYMSSSQFFDPAKPAP